MAGCFYLRERPGEEAPASLRLALPLDRAGALGCSNRGGGLLGRSTREAGGLLGRSILGGGLLGRSALDVGGLLGRSTREAGGLLGRSIFGGELLGRSALDVAGLLGLSTRDAGGLLGVRVIGRSICAGAATGPGVCRCVLGAGLNGCSVRDDRPVSLADRLGADVSRLFSAARLDSTARAGLTLMAEVLESGISRRGPSPLVVLSLPALMTSVFRRPGPSMTGGAFRGPSPSTLPRGRSWSSRPGR